MRLMETSRETMLLPSLRKPRNPSRSCLPVSNEFMLHCVTHAFILGDGSPTRAQLEKEYAFLDVITTFLRALRAGVLDFRLSSTLLAHHGRLGPAFDLCSKVTVDVLREEGMYKSHGDVVAQVVCKALTEVRLAF